MLFVALMAVGILPGDLAALAQGAASVGRAPAALLSGVQFPVLLIAVAYAGSGGTLLLAQSLWVREKGFGMGTYQGRVAGIRGTQEVVEERGFAFSAKVPIALGRFKKWMSIAEKELLVTFVGLIILSVVITSLLVSATIGTHNGDIAGNLTGMVAGQAEMLLARGGVWMQVAFLLGGAFVLFSTQVGIVDTVTRISGDILHDLVGRKRGWSVRGVFLALLTAFVAAGVLVVALSWAGGRTLGELEPNFLILIAGPFTIISMWCFTMVVAVLNTTKLPAGARMPAWKLIGMYWAVVLWGWFSVETLSRFVLSQLPGVGSEVVNTVAMHPVRIVFYAIWIASLIWLIVRTAPAGFARQRA
jgi:hypothetical protein